MIRRLQFLGLSKKSIIDHPQGMENPLPAPEADQTAAEPLPASQPIAIDALPRSSRLLISGCLVLGISLIAGGLFYHQRFYPLVEFRSTWAIILFGMFFVVVSRLAAKNARFRSSLINRRQVVLLIMSFVLVVIAAYSAGPDLKMRLPWFAITGWLVAIALVLAAGWQEGAPKIGFNRKVILTLVVLFGIAMLLRGLGTAEIPRVLSGDEASSGISSVAFVNGDMDNIFTVGWFSFPSLFYYLQSISLRIFGQTTPALRLFSAFAGALTVAAVYLLARELFGELCGLAAGIFMAGFHFHINFSRIGLNNIWDAFWFVAALGLLWKGWRSERRLYYLLAGLAIGLAQYFYVSARLLPFMFAAWIFLVGILDRPRLRRSLSHLIFMALVALVVFLPLGLFFIQHPDEFSAPMNRVTIFSQSMKDSIQTGEKSFWQIMYQQLCIGLQSYTHIPLRYWYQPNTPLLRPFPASAFLLGLLYLAVKPKDDRFLLLGLWVFSFALTVSFSDSPPASQRLVGVAPASAILVAFGVIETFQHLGNLWPKVQKSLLWAGLLVVLLLALDDTFFYFYEYTPSSQFGGDHTMIAQDLADYLQDKDSNWKVLFLGYPAMGCNSIMSLAYLAPNIECMDINGDWTPDSSPQLLSGSWLFVFLNNHDADLATVRAQYPGGEQRQIYRRYPGKGVLYRSYEITLQENPLNSR